MVDLKLMGHRLSRISESRVAVTCTALVLVSAAFDFIIPTDTGKTVVKTYWDVQYYSGPDADPAFHTLDLHVPVGKKDRAATLFVHGGGWRGGDKSPEDRVNLFRLFNKRIGAVASVNYRLSPEHKHPAHVHDVARAFRWLYEHAPDYGIDRERIYVTGHSAGAHLVSLLALDPRYLEREGLSVSDIRGVLSISGVYDLPNFWEPGVAPTRLEQAFGDETEILRDASPALKVVNASPTTPPFQIAYASRELFGLKEQAKRFYALFLRQRLPVELVEIPGRDHYDIVDAVGDQKAVRDVNGRPVISIDDLLGPSLLRFIESVEDGSLNSSFRAVWPEGGPPAVPDLPEPPVRVVRDLQYYGGTGADPELNALDLYLPEAKTNFPLLVQVHGGAWRVGDKKSPYPKTLVDLLGRLGWGVASINYRLSPKVKHPTHIRDVARAFAWLFRNAEQYGIDRDRIALIGHSAGAHLVSLLALDTGYLKEQGIPPNAVKAVVPTSGVYDLAAFMEPGVVPRRKAQAFGTDQAILRDASPIHHIRPAAPPFLVTYTDQDFYLLPEEAHRFHQALRNKGVDARLMLIPDRRHCCPIGYRTGIGQPPVAQVDDVLGVALVDFLSDVLGATEEIEQSARPPGSTQHGPSAHTDAIPTVTESVPEE